MRTKIMAIAGVALLLALVFWSPFEREEEGFTDVLRYWGDEQKELSDELTSKAVAGAEGKYVGEHKEDGSNWSIPNILRSWFGIDLA